MKAPFDVRVAGVPEASRLRYRCRVVIPGWIELPFSYRTPASALVSGSVDGRIAERDFEGGSVPGVHLAGLPGLLDGAGRTTGIREVLLVLEVEALDAGGGAIRARSPAVSVTLVR